jgi:hypothetical protein
MNTIWQFMVAHQVITTLIAGALWSAFIGALPAPTATSTTFYQFFFKFMNLMAANVSRAFASVEKSPNFQAAVDIQTKMAGQPAIDVQPAPPRP